MVDHLYLIHDNLLTMKKGIKVSSSYSSQETFVALLSLHEKSPNAPFFLIRIILSVKIQENTHQKNSVFRLISRIA